VSKQPSKEKGVRETKLRRDSGKKYSKGEKLSRFNELTTRISSGGNRVTPDRQIWKSCEAVSREILWKSTGVTKSVCVVDPRERIRGGNPWTSGEIVREN
jgi:hypothetical protein